MTAYTSQTTMEAALARMCELMQNDAAFREGTKKAHLSVSFEITDIDFVYLLAFDQGTVTGKPSAAPDEADVELSMSSDAFDRMFSGALIPMQAALTGELAFSGDVAAAMGLQGLLPRMISAYKAAKTG